MMVMTAKVNIKKILIALAAVVGVILGLIFLLGGGRSEPTGTAAMSANDARVKFLEDLGWSVSASPVQSGQVKVPTESSEVYSRYNDLQKEAGYDLTQYAGKTVMRYVYKVNNHESTEPVYATLLVYKDQIVGGDVLDTAPGGKIVSLKKTTD